MIFKIKWAFNKNSIFWQSKLRAKTSTAVFSRNTFWSK